MTLFLRCGQKCLRNANLVCHPLIHYHPGMLHQKVSAHAWYRGWPGTATMFKLALTNPSLLAKKVLLTQLGIPVLCRFAL